MRFIQKYLVRMHGRGLLFKDGDFINFIMPGKYRLYGIWHRYALERYGASQAESGHRLEDYLVEKLRGALRSRDPETPGTASDDAGSLPVVGGLDALLNGLVKMKQ